MIRDRRVLLPLAGAVLLAACPEAHTGGGGGDAPEAKPHAGTIVEVETGEFVPAPVVGGTVGADGGSVTITDASSPLEGLTIVVPPGAVSEPVTFEISSAPLTDLRGLPEDAAATGGIIQIRATGTDSWNVHRKFERPVEVTVPYVPPAEAAETVNLYVLDDDGSLEPAGMASHDLDAHLIKFYTSTFADSAEAAPGSSVPQGSGFWSSRGSLAPQPNADYMRLVAIGLTLAWESWLVEGKEISTGFATFRDGFYIPNYGSYLDPSRGGNCAGMVYYARWHFEHIGGLFFSYDDDEHSDTWLDDAVAIQLASRAHEAESKVFDARLDKEWGFQHPDRASQRLVGLSYLGGLYVTGQPVMVGIFQRMKIAGKWRNAGGHEIMIHAADIAQDGLVTFHVYDPNFPSRDEDVQRSERKITFRFTGDPLGFAVYPGGPDASTSTYLYNYFEHDGYRLFGTDQSFHRLWEAAERGFADDSIFPTIEITSLRGKDQYDDLLASTCETPWGDHCWSTPESAVVIEGTVSGGRADSPLESLHVLVGGQWFETPITGGTFSGVLPLRTGHNELVLIAAQADDYQFHWAGFLRDVIRSDAAQASLTVTMSWDQDASDVDLYVKEPDTEAGAAGDVIYYQHRKGSDPEHPYLDIDNTQGYGPEHYYARTGMTTLAADGTPSTGLYGTYQLRTHYYADHDADAETVQPISFHLSYRYLEFCPVGETDCEARGFWAEGAFEGGLGAAASGNCCSFANAGADWSGTFEIEYPQPDPADYNVPDPPTAMLP